MKKLIFMFFVFYLWSYVFNFAKSDSVGITKQL